MIWRITQLIEDMAHEMETLGYEMQFTRRTSVLVGEIAFEEDLCK